MALLEISPIYITYKYFLRYAQIFHFKTAITVSGKIYEADNMFLQQFPLHLNIARRNFARHNSHIQNEKPAKRPFVLVLCYRFVAWRPDTARSGWPFHLSVRFFNRRRFFTTFTLDFTHREKSKVVDFCYTLYYNCQSTEPRYWRFRF